MAGGHVMFNDATTPDAENLFKAVVSGEKDSFPGGREKQEHVRVFVICDDNQCYVEYIFWYGLIHGARRTRGAPAPAPLMYSEAALLLVFAPDVQAAPFTDVPECVSILLLTSRKMDKRLIASLLSSGVPRLTEFKGKHLTVSGRIFTLHACASPPACCLTVIARECVGLKCNVQTGERAS